MRPRIEAAVAAGRRAGVPLVVNARVDVYINSLGDPEGRLDESLRRAEKYLAAGADCIFVPAVGDRETIAALARGIEGPLNVLATAETPSTAELRELGVARVSVGSGLFHATLPLVEQAARDVLERGSFEFLAGASAFPDVQALLRAESQG
jgi:2-methylisocitrate lyase-like PEP mutase family enzyme